MKKTRYPIMNMGTISILTIFIILCMVTFAALTYISTRRDASFTDRLASRTSGYYAAVSKPTGRSPKSTAASGRPGRTAHGQIQKKTIPFLYL